MPIISIFYGIIVRMYNEKGSKHHVPHIHVEVAGEKAVFDFEGNILEGNFPSNKTKLLQAWILIHKEDLETNWKLLNSGEQFFRIDPLK